MKKFIPISLFTIVALVIVIILDPHQVNADNSENTIGVIVQYGEGSIGELRRSALSFDGEIKDVTEELNVALIELNISDGDDAGDVIEKLEATEGIVRAEINYQYTPHLIPGDTLFTDQWSHHNTGQTTSSGVTASLGADVDMVEMYDFEDVNAHGMVAVIDSGINYEHPDVGRLWDGSGLCVNEDKEEIESGCPHHGWEFSYNEDDPYDEGHGATVASVIHFTVDNSEGMAGSSSTDGIAVMGLSTPGLYTYDIYQAINFAKNNGARVINASFGGLYYSSFMRDAIEDFNGLFVTSSGNGGDDGIGDNVDSESTYPCSYNLDNIICVAATDEHDELTDFSNYGDDSVDVAAPGINIVVSEGEDDYTTGNGTSYAAPFVSALAAQLFAHHSHLSVDEVKNYIYDYADQPTSLMGKLATDGRINMRTSLDALLTDEGTEFMPYISNGDQDINVRLSSGKYVSYFTTDRPASCQYTTVSGTPYTSANVNGDGTTHSITLIDLEEGEGRIVYVRCEDGRSGVVNDTDYEISINVEVLDETPPIISIVKHLDELVDYRGDETFILRSSESGYLRYDAWDRCPYFYPYMISEGDNVIEMYWSDADQDYKGCDLQVVDDLGNESNEVTLRPFRSQMTPLTPLFRLYNTLTGVHLYTRGEDDRDKVLERWTEFDFSDGGAAFYAPLTEPTLDDTFIPIYRLYNTRTGVHLYTRGENDRDKILDKWSDFEFTDGVPAFYASDSDHPGFIPIYRLYNTRTGVHLYTRGETDRNKVLGKWKDFEFTDGGAAFYLPLKTPF